MPRSPSLVLEKERRLSESLVWDVQRRFYEQQGPAAWAGGGIPWYATSNAFVARGYARVVAAFLSDCAAQGTLDRSRPVYVLELASGSGHLAFLLLRELTALSAAHPVLRGLPWCLVMTDLAQANIDAWMRHERLVPFAESGRLDFARFDIETDTQVTLLRAGVSLTAEAPGNPLVAIANYAFDSTRQDAFVVKDGVLHEALVTTERREAGTEPPLMGELKTRFTLAPLAPGRYPDAHAEGLLQDYGLRKDEGWLLVPTGALGCVSHLLALSGGRLLLLSADKGVVHEDELAGLKEPQRVGHGGCFSMLVNYHAVGEYFRRAGGRLLGGASRDKSLKVVAGVAGAGDCPETRLAFDGGLGLLGPFDYFNLIRTVKKQVEEPTLDTILALQRLGAGDYRVVVEFAGPLARYARKATPEQRREIMDALALAEAGFYPVNRDLPFQVGRLRMALGRPLEAARAFYESLRLFGSRTPTLFNLALSLHALEQDALALKLLDQAIALSPDEKSFPEWRARIAAKLAG